MKNESFLVSYLTLHCVKIASGKLGCDVWIAPDTEAAAWLKSEGIVEGIYTAEEVRMLKGTSLENLQAVHMAKTSFEGAEVVRVSKPGKISCTARTPQKSKVVSSAGFCEGRRGANTSQAM